MPPTSESHPRLTHYADFKVQRFKLAIHLGIHMQTIPRSSSPDQPSQQAPSRSTQHHAGTDLVPPTVYRPGPRPDHQPPAATQPAQPTQSRSRELRAAGLPHSFPQPHRRRDIPHLVPQTAYSCYWHAEMDAPAEEPAPGTARIQANNHQRDHECDGTRACSDAAAFGGPESSIREASTRYQSGEPSAEDNIPEPQLEKMEEECKALRRRHIQEMKQWFRCWKTSEPNIVILDKDIGVLIGQTLETEQGWSYHTNRGGSCRRHLPWILEGRQEDHGRGGIAVSRYSGWCTCLHQHHLRVNASVALSSLRRTS